MADKTNKVQALSNEGGGNDIVSLCTAAETGDTARVCLILETNPTLVRHQDSKRRTPLHYAVFGGHAETARVLVEAGVDPLRGFYPVSDEFSSPLAMAQDQGLEEIAAMMLTALNRRKGATTQGEAFCQAIRDGELNQVYLMMKNDPAVINETDMKGDTPLHVAAVGLRRQMVNDLLNGEAEADKRSAKGLRPIEALLEQHSFNPRAHVIAGILLAHGAAYDIWVAAALGHLAGVKEFLSEDPSLVNYNSSRGFGNWSIFFPLTVAARNGYREVVEVLLDSQAEPDAAIHTSQVSPEHPVGYPESGLPLLYALENRHHSIAHLLLDRGAKADANGVYAGGRPGDYALICDERSLADRLILGGGRPYLFTYAKAKNYAVLAEMLKPSRGGGDFDEFKQGYPENVYQILHWAIYFGDRELLKLCLEQEPACENTIWFEHLSQLWRREAGSGQRRARLLVDLLDYGVDPNIRSRHGLALLHHIFECAKDPDHSQEIKIALTRVLLDQGADINTLDENLRSSPLAWACMRGHTKLAGYLLDHGADPDAGGAPWSKPLAWANRRRHLDIVSLLNQYGASTCTTC